MGSGVWPFRVIQMHAANGHISELLLATFPTFFFHKHPKPLAIEVNGAL
jgi:hypothetical protein